MIFTPIDAKRALEQIAVLKGKERAQLIERIWRWETNHFKSLQFKLTGSAGMEAGKWKDLPSGLSIITMNDNHPEKVKEVQRKFIVWNDCFAFCMYLSNYIDRNDGNFARWNSTSETKQQIYAKCIASVKNRFIK